MIAKMFVLCLLAISVSVVFGQTGEATASNIPPTNPDVWSPGRITQIVLAVLESALLTLILLFPSLMDPVVTFINHNIGTVGSRRRRAVRTAMTEQAASIHNLFLDALDKFQEMDATLALELY